MANQYVNKVIIGNEVKIDLTGDDITAEKLAKGIKAHDKSGAPIVGTCPFDTDTSEATATAAEVLNGKTFGAGGEVKTGSMPNQGGKTLEVTEKGAAVTIPAGYHDGSGKAKIAGTEEAKLIPANIREGITGSMSGSEGMKPQAKSVTPSFSSQEVLPDDDYNCLSSVTVAAIPVSYTDNAQGGQTLKVG